MLQEDVHTDRIAVWKYEEIPVTGYRVYSSVNIAVLPNMVAWNPRPYTFSAPAMLGLVDPSKASFILKHQSNPFAAVENFS